MTVHLPIFSKTCGECTKCCEGWLSGAVHGYKMYRGNGCHFLEKSCKIYNERPENPCKSYDCVWLSENLPGWMKPNLSNVIITKRLMQVPTSVGMKKLEYYDVIEAGNIISPQVLNWLVHWAIDNDINLAYELDGKVHTIGDQQFKKLFL